jgi:hypothetical protein
MEIYDVYVPYLQDVPSSGEFIAYLHSLVFGIVLVTTFQRLPRITRILNACLHVIVLSGFLWFKRCWLLELEKRLLKSTRQDHVFVQILYMVPPKYRKSLFLTTQLSLAIFSCALAWAVF